MSDRPATDPVRRLNPFSFPAETDVRFTLLIAVAIMLSVNLVINVLPIPPAASSPGDTAGALLDLARSLGRLLVMALYSAIVLGLAQMLHRGHPRRLWRRGGLRRVTDARDPRLAEACQTLADEAGLAEMPVIAIDETSTLTDGQAFGMKGQYVVRLGGRMPLLLRKRPALFEATVLHEYAHIRNDDVERVYFSQSLWLVALLLALLPFLLFRIGRFAVGLVDDVIPLMQGTSDYGRFIRALLANAIVIAQAIMLAGVVAITRSGLLRVREVYSDWRAALWGAEDGLQTILERNAPDEKRGFLSGLLGLHPPIRRRLEALRDPLRLFALSLDLPLITGLLTGTLLPGAYEISSEIAFNIVALLDLSGFGAGPVPAPDGPVLPLIIVGWLIVLMLYLLIVIIFFGPLIVMCGLVSGSLGMQAQREAAAGMTAGAQGCGPYLRLLAPAGLFTLGFWIGLLITPANRFAPLDLIVHPDLRLGHYALMVGETILWWLTMIVVMAVWLAGLRFLAQRALGRYARVAAPRGKRRFLTALFAVLLSLIALPSLLGQGVIWRNVYLQGRPDILNVGTVLNGMLIASIFYVIFFVGGWLIVEVERLISRPRCHHCDERAPAGTLLGAYCPNCGADLAPWLFADPPAYASATLERRLDM